MHVIIQKKKKSTVWQSLCQSPLRPFALFFFFFQKVTKKKKSNFFQIDMNV